MCKVFFCHKSLCFGRNRTKMWFYTALIVMISLGANGDSSQEQANQDNPIVTVKEGKLRGSVKTILDGTPYYSFKGIPYAQPPVGKLRFKAPLPPKQWKGIRNATEHGSVCTQYDGAISQSIVGNEDCLFLNVYTKSLNPKSKIPVMVFIHGGSFSSGSGDATIYGPEFFFQHDIILVTINYRLEVLGFLCLEIPEVPGNAGAKDQVLALRWLKHNIAKFGGDPDNITIFGESAGSASVTYHMVSLMSRGLFHKVIAQSGVCIQDWAIASGALERAFRVGKVLGKETNNANELLQFLRSVPAEELANLTLKTRTADEEYRTELVNFAPVVEKKFHNVVAFINEKPIDTLIAKKVNKVPFMVGYNSAEGLLVLSDVLEKSDVLNSHPAYLVPREITQKVSEAKTNTFGERIKRFYVGYKDLSNDTAVSIVNMQSDIQIAYNTHRFLHFYSELKVPTYMYRFDYDTELNIFKKLLGYSNMKGACHADDVFYLFYNILNKDIYEGQEKLREIVFTLTKLWTDFAKTGNPTPGSDQCITWKPFTTCKKEYIILDEKLSLGKRAEQDRVNFLNQIYCESGLPCISGCYNKSVNV